MDTTTQAIGTALRALQDAREAYTQGRLTDCRRLLRFAANESDDAAVSLNAAIYNSPECSDKQ